MTQKSSSISLSQALLPVIILVLLLAFNVFVFGDDALGGSNQFILLIGAAVAAIVGFRNKISYDIMLEAIGSNLKSTTGAILILLFVGALAGTWLLSGIIPAMIYYGLQILHPSIFLPACIIICAIISLATGSSWTTSATVGIALIGIGRALEIPVGMVAGAVISGAYFGDKLSPLSDTTNLAPAMAGTDLFTHIRYMTYTTVPSIVITLIVFLFLGFFQETNGQADTQLLLDSIDERFTINLGLFIVPMLVIFMIVRKAPPLVALMIGTLLGGGFALLYQPHLVLETAEAVQLNITSAYRGIMNAITIDNAIVTSNDLLNDLFTSGGMQGMLGTIWLIICAMVFGGVMDAIGGLQKLSSALLEKAQSTFQLFAGTAASCVINTSLLYFRGKCLIKLTATVD
jgi:NhaC family Na+:H+ antiporter